MVSLHHIDGTPRVNVLSTPALITLLLKGVAGFNIIVLPIVFTGGFEFPKGARGGLSLLRLSMVIRLLRWRCPLGID